MARDMTAVNYALIVGGLVWIALLVACRATYAQLRQRLAGVDPPTWEALRARDALDVRELLTWYTRVRRYVRQDSAQAAGVEVITQRLRRLINLVEIGFVVLAVAIAIVGVHNVFIGAYQPR
jgi:hypothetical protein